MPATSKSFNKEKSARFADPDEEIPSLEVAAKEEVSKEEVSKEKTPPVNYFSLYRTASRLDWVCIIIGTLGALGNGAAWPIFAIIFGEFTDTFGDATRSSSFMDDVSNIALYFLYLGIGSAVCAYLQASLWIWAGNQQANRLRQLYLRAVLKQDIPFFDTQATTGQLLQTLNDDSQQVQAAISEKAAHFLQHTSTFIVGWVVAFAKGWDMTLVMIGCLPFLAAVGASLAKMSSTTQAKAQEAYQKASSIAQQAISQARTVVAYGQEEKSIQDYDAQLEEPAKAGVRQAFFTGISLGGINTVVYCTYAVAFIYGAWRVKTGDYTGGQVLQVLVAALLGGFSLGQAAPVLETFTRGCSAGGRLFAVIERKPAISLDEEGGEAPESVRGEIELRDVHFCYPARPDVAVFTEFNLLIPAGKTVALVGESGSGKSTVVSLIERFYDPAAGAVLLDGVDLRRYNLRWLRSQVGLVSQEPTLFATNIYDNIAMGREGASQEEIEAAARAANAHEFISNLPLKYQTQVGERGLQLSGGQKQRIAIARAILKNPKILLLDEATSALDTQSERLVQEALDRMVVGRTTVVVAHRLSTVQDADIIAAVKQGRVVEQGSHEELIQNPVGMYTALVKIQMQKAEEEEERKKKGAEAEEDDEVDTSDEVVEGGAENTLEGHHSGANGIEQAAKVAALPEATTTDHVALAVTQPVGTRAAAAAAGPNSKEWWPIKRVSGEKRVSQERRRSHQLEGGPASDRALQAGADQHGPASNTQLPGVQGDYDHDAKDKDRDAKEEKPVDVPLSRLIAYNKPEWKYAVVGVVASAAAGCINPSFALIISSFIGVFYETSKSEMLQKAGFWSGMFVVIGAGSLLSTTLQQFCFGVMGQRLARRLRVMLFRAIMHQEIGWFDLEANSSGILTTRLSADASHVRGAVGDTLSLILQNIACLAFGYIVAFVFMWRMALLITGALPFMIAGASIYYKMVTGFESGADKLYGQANQAVSDAFSSVRVVQAYNLQEPVSRLYEARLGEANKTMLRRSQITGVLMAYSQFATFAVYGLIIWFGGYEVDKGHSSFEDMLKAFLAVLISALGIAQSQIGFPDAGKAKGAIQAIFPIIDRKPLIDASDPAGLQPDKVQGEIELVNIKFVYPSRKTVVVFRHFNLTIPAGKTVALVGESGSGKSTVVGLIERFYDPAEGSVLLDNIDLRQYNLRWLRSQIALVSQEPLLFSCSMLDNIRYGRPDASMEDVIEAAKAANIHSLIDKMPEKYDTQVGERGIQLSGGQKQRVAIARAVLKNPRILLLDEATSALDSQSERLVQDALDRIMVGRTSVVVAHRLSTIRNAHLIALVFRGRVLEKGTHEELMAIPNGGYAALVAAQMGSKSSRSQSLNAAAAAAAAAALPTVTP